MRSKAFSYVSKLRVKWNESCLFQSSVDNNPCSTSICYYMRSKAFSYVSKLQIKWNKSCLFQSSVDNNPCSTSICNYTCQYMTTNKHIYELVCMLFVSSYVTNKNQRGGSNPSFFPFYFFGLAPLGWMPILYFNAV